MQIVIDIPDEKYDRLLYQDIISLRSYVENGIVLPKGHGRLGDLDALRDEVSSWGISDYEPEDFIEEIDRAETIIEADQEGEE